MLFILSIIHEEEIYHIIALLFSPYVRKRMVNHAAIGSARLAQDILSRWCTMASSTATCKSYAKLIT